MDRRRRTNRLASYRPYAKQREFHLAGAAYRERLFMAGNQLGKTLAGAAEATMHLTGRYPEGWNGKRFNKPIVMLAGSESYELTRDGVQRLLIGPPMNEEEWGMRNNNPGNIKFVGQKVPGIVGPSVNTDQGDPQAVFETPEAGMSAMFSLAKRKYDGGKKSTNQLIAGNMGWTPGNYDAAANVARTMGIRPDDDINLNDPDMATRFMQALILQEHGQKGRLYPQEMIRSVVGGGRPVQVASTDPTAGMPTAAAAINAVAPPSGSVAPQANPQASAYVDPRVSAPNYQQPANQMTPPQNRPANMQLQPQSQQAALPPLPSRDVAAPPPVASVPPQQVAQAGPPQMPRIQPYRPDPEMLKLLSNPFLDDGQRAALRMVMQQQMQEAAAAQEEQTWRARQDYETQQRRSDPAYQANIEQTRVQTQRLKEGTRPLTADERRSWGIPESDTRPYAMAPGGKPELIGASGQTINVGGQIEARKQAAETMGLKPDDPRYMGYVLNGELPKESQQNLTAIDKKAIQDADDMVAANQSALDALSQAEGLSEHANSGWFAGKRAAIGNNLPDWLVPDVISSPESSKATTDMDNAIIGQAVTQLKTIFGGNPTEGERAILLELQGSSTMPRDVRKNVFARAKALAQKRLEFNQNRANDLRGGTYYKPNREAATGANIDDLLKKYGGQ